MIKQSEFKKWFPDDRLLRVPASVLPDDLSHVATRQLLSEIGIPESFLEVVEIDPGIIKEIPSIAAIYKQYGEVPPPKTEHLFYLGFAGQPFLAIDGSTGEVLQVHRRFGSRLLANSLESFFRILGGVSMEIRAQQRWPQEKADQSLAELYGRTTEHMRQIDPGMLSEAGSAWRDILSDITAASVD